MTNETLKSIVKKFDNDAPVVLAIYDNETGKTNMFHLEICANRDYQKKTNTIMFYQGIRKK